MAKTPAQRGALGRRRKTAGYKAAATKRHRADAQKALAMTRKQNESSPKKPND
jgi:hypothetical protein